MFAFMYTGFRRTSKGIHFFSKVYEGLRSFQRFLQEFEEFRASNRTIKGRNLFAIISFRFPLEAVPIQCVPTAFANEFVEAFL